MKRVKYTMINVQNIYGSVAAAVKEISVECGLGYV